LLREGGREKPIDRDDPAKREGRKHRIKPPTKKKSKENSFTENYGEPVLEPTERIVKRT